MTSPSFAVYDNVSVRLGPPAEFQAHHRSLRSCLLNTGIVSKNPPSVSIVVIKRNLPALLNTGSGKMSLAESLPWAQKPLIINAPMGGYAGSELAIAVTKAGGLGQIGNDANLKELQTQLQQVEQALGRKNGLLPIGVGLLSFVTDQDAAVAIMAQYRPAVVWLFAAKELNDYTTWAGKLRKASPDSQVWIQVGNVETALYVAEKAKPDVMCVQGADAGGHGFEDSAGIISLLPEVADALADAGFKTTLVASGGISEGRAAAAAFTLGAQGVVIGTRFLSASETIIHPRFREAVLATSDGAKTTIRAKLFDELRGPNKWPGTYDGRSIKMKSFHEYRDGGVDLDEIRRRHNEAIQQDDKGFGLEGRAAMWAGSGVGLVKKEQPAGEIVDDLRKGIVEALSSVRSRI